jgi:hypothetical protein
MAVADDCRGRGGRSMVGTILMLASLVMVLLLVYGPHR